MIAVTCLSRGWVLAFMAFLQNGQIFPTGFELMYGGFSCFCNAQVRFKVGFGLNGLNRIFMRKTQNLKKVHQRHSMDGILCWMCKCGITHVAFFCWMHALIDRLCVIDRKMSDRCFGIRSCDYELMTKWMYLRVGKQTNSKMDSQGGSGHMNII